jgi:hypothetical protein
VSLRLADARRADLEFRLPDTAPAYTWDFSVSLPAGVTFERATGVEYVGPSGLVLSAPANTPCWPYRWSGSVYAPVGMRYLPARSNLIANNTDPTGWVINTLTPGLTCTFGTAIEAGQTIVTTRMQGHVVSGSDYSRVRLGGNGIPCVDADSLSAAAFVRVLAAPQRGGLSLSLRTNGGIGSRNSSTISGTASSSGLMTRNLLTASGGAYKQTNGVLAPYLFYNFSSNVTVDVTVGIGLATACFNVSGVAAPILNSTGAPLTQAADRVTVPLPAGAWEVCITTDASAYWLDGVEGSPSGWTVPELLGGAVALVKVEAWRAKRPSRALRESRAPTPIGAPSSSLVIRPSDVATNDVGELTTWRGAEGDSLAAPMSYAPAPPDDDDEPDDGGDDGPPSGEAPDPALESDRPLTGEEDGVGFVELSQGTPLRWTGVKGYGANFSIGVCLSSYEASSLLMTILGAQNAKGTDDLNDSIQLEIGRGWRALSAIIDHAVMSQTGPVVSFDGPVVLKFTKSGRECLWTAASVSEPDKVYSVRGEIRSRDFGLVARTVLIVGQRYNRSQQFSGRLWSDGKHPALAVWAQPHTPAQDARHVQAWATDLAIAMQQARAGADAAITRAYVTNQTTSGFQICWYASKSSSVAWEIATDPEFRSIVHTTAAKAATGYSADALGGKWWMGHHVVEGLPLADTRYYYRPLVGGRIAPIRASALQSVLTFPTDGKLRIVLISCSKIASARYDSFEAIAALNPAPHLVIHLGDLRYTNIAVDDIHLQRRLLIPAFMDNPSVRAVIDHIAIWWMIDDHCSGPNNNHLDMVLPLASDGRRPTMAQILANDRQAYGECFPHTRYAEKTNRRTLAQQWDVGPFRFIAPDLFSQRQPAKGTVLNGGPDPWDQYGWLCASAAQAKADGKTAIYLISSFDAWRKLCPAEVAGFLAAVRASGVDAEMWSGDVHQSRHESGKNTGLRLRVSSPVAHSTPAGGQTPYPADWMGRTLRVTDNTQQFMPIMLDMATREIVASLIAKPYANKRGTDYGRASTDELMPALSWAPEGANIITMPGRTISRQVARDIAAGPLAAMVGYSASGRGTGALDLGVGQAARSISATAPSGAGPFDAATLLPELSSRVVLAAPAVWRASVARVDVQAMVRAMSTEATDAYVAALQAAVGIWDASGAWGICALLACHCPPTLADSLFDLKVPSRKFATGTVLPEFAPYKYTKGRYDPVANAHAYLKLTAGNADLGASYTSGVAAVAQYIVQGDAPENAYTVGATNASNTTQGATRLGSRWTDGTCHWQLNRSSSAADATPANTTARGLFVLSRTSTAAAAAQAYRNTTLLGAGNGTANALTTREITLFRERDAATGEYVFSTERGISWTWFGGSLNDPTTGAAMRAALKAGFDGFAAALGGLTA